LGDVLNLSDSRDNPIAFVLNDSAYFGLGSSGFFTVSYYNDILKINLPVNYAPTDITISEDSISENIAIGWNFATLSTNDENDNDFYNYTLVEGQGDGDNGCFTISGDILRVNNNINYEVKPSLSIRVRTTDNDGAFFEKAIIIPVKNENEPPISIILSNSSVKENQPVGKFIGWFTSTDDDNAEAHTYTLASGTGDTDNNSFYISNDSIFTNSIFDYENKSSCSVRIRSTDKDGLYYERPVTIYIIDEDESPVDIILSNDNLDENQPVGTLTGFLSAIDFYNNQPDYYFLTEGQGDTDNSSFYLLGNQLYSNEVFNYEEKHEYSIRLKVVDFNYLSYEKAFTIYVNDINDEPSDISISNDSIFISSVKGSLVGIFTTTDEDENDVHVYSFVSADTLNSADSVYFKILIDNLLLDKTLQESKKFYEFLIKSTDKAGLSFTKRFLINVTGDRVGFKTYRQIPSSVLVYPNPAGNFISIENISEFDEIKELVLFNSLGQAEIFVNEINRNYYKLDVSRLNPGIYYLIIVENEKKYYKKIVIK